jgi:hypothetical protein
MVNFLMSDMYIFLTEDVSDKSGNTVVINSTTSRDMAIVGAYSVGASVFGFSSLVGVTFLSKVEGFATQKQIHPDDQRDAFLVLTGNEKIREQVRYKGKFSDYVYDDLESIARLHGETLTTGDYSASDINRMIEGLAVTHGVNATNLKLQIELARSVNQ